jgi:hypothetical protein
MMPTRWFPGSGKKVGNWAVSQRFFPQEFFFSVPTKTFDGRAVWLLAEFAMYSAALGPVPACAGGIDE